MCEIVTFQSWMLSYLDGDAIINIVRNDKAIVHDETSIVPHLWPTWVVYQQLQKKAGRNKRRGKVREKRGEKERQSGEERKMKVKKGRKEGEKEKEAWEKGNRDGKSVEKKGVWKEKMGELIRILSIRTYSLLYNYCVTVAAHVRIIWLARTSLH